MRWTAYEIMGLDRNTTEQGLRSRYRLLCHLWHPDKSQDLGSAAFRQLQEAYQILKDPQKKSQLSHLKLFERKLFQETNLSGRSLLLMEHLDRLKTSRKKFL